MSSCIATIATESREGVRGVAACRFATAANPPAPRASAPVKPVKTAHFAERQRQRQVSDASASLTCRCGLRFHEGEDVVCFLGRRQIPAEAVRLGINPARAEGMVVIACKRCGRLRTTFRNPQFLYRLKRRRWHSGYHVPCRFCGTSSSAAEGPLKDR